MASPGSSAAESSSANKKTAAKSPLTFYFLIVLFCFSSLSILVNNNFVHDVHLRGEDNVINGFLKDFKVSNMEEKIKEVMEKVAEVEGTPTAEPGSSDGDDDGGDEEEEEDNDNEQSEEENEKGDNDKDADNEEKNEEDEEGDSSDAEKNDKPVHNIANLSCEAYGGPSNEDAEEMVYWEDIPKDALHMSPFHPHNKITDVTTPITQFLTFEPDAGGWNNIRMAMETVLTLAFAMGRTLVLPPHQGMYLIDKQKDGQQSKFSFDNFFHMESISNEHIGLNIITTTEFMELCVEGKIVDTQNKPIYPPGMRVNWDGAQPNERQQLKKWLRDNSGQNLLHWDPDHCIAAFPASNSEEDAKKLAALPQQIEDSPGKFPPYESYIGKPNAVDAPAIERLKEMHGERKHLCEYTPELQTTQWLHFPVGMKTEDGDTSRLLVHFYAFLFFQDWKQDLWTKRFVRDHVRYIDAIQCAAARVVAALRKRVSDRTKGASSDFDTIHIRRGDFQFKETRVEASVILEQLKRVLKDNTTLYIATDERNKTFFNDIVNHYPDVVFLDDMMGELEGINTNYYGMIDQLVASRGKTFFGCWFSTFTGYINRLRGYHADDHELPGYEQGIINSYYYAMPDRFSHMKEYWPIKKQFYAREFPASWRLIDTSTS